MSEYLVRLVPDILSRLVFILPVILPVNQTSFADLLPELGVGSAGEDVVGPESVAHVAALGGKVGLVGQRFPVDWGLLMIVDVARETKLVPVVAESTPAPQNQCPLIRSQPLGIR